jgi:hypothetical protein
LVVKFAKRDEINCGLGKLIRLKNIEKEVSQMYLKT